MELTKKYKCVHCGGVVECSNGVCTVACACGKVKLSGQVIVEGTLGIDYVDVSQKYICG